MTPKRPARIKQMDIIAGNIAGLMIRQRMDAESLAGAMATTERTIRKRLSEPQTLTGEELEKICVVFNVTMEQLSRDICT